MDIVSLFVAVKILKAHIHYFVVLTVGVPGFKKCSSLLLHIICVDCKSPFLGKNEPDTYLVELMW